MLVQSTLEDDVFYDKSEEIINVLDELNINIHGFEDCFGLLYVSFQDIQEYLEEMDPKNADMIKRYLSEKQDQLIEIEAALYDHLDELKVFKNKLIDHIIQVETNNNRSHLTYDLNSFKN